jgi:hypothetical protein
MEELFLVETLFVVCCISVISILVYKTVLYAQYPRGKRKWVNWLYFGLESRVNSSTDKMLRLKKRQNFFTVLLLVFTILGLFLYTLVGLLVE